MPSKEVQEFRESLTRLLETLATETLKNSVRTALPANIVSFDPETQLASVQIAINRVTLKGEAKKDPVIKNCPVCVYGAAGGLVEVKIEEGDECLIMFSMRCLDNWRNEGGIARPAKFSIMPEKDAFVLLAPHSKPNAIEGYSNDGIKIRSLDGNNYSWVKDDGTIELQNENGIATLEPGGNAVINGCTIDTSGNVITANGTNLDELRDIYNTHTHTGDSGGSTTGPNQTA